MKKIMLAALILLISFLFQSCHKISGDGPVVTKTYTVSDFTGITSDIDADIYYTQDNFYKIEIEAQQNIQDIMYLPVVNGELRIQFERYKNVWSHSRIIVRITAPSISSLGINGSGNLWSQQPITTNNMNVKLTGSGMINVSQISTQTLTVNISGSGTITTNGGTANGISTRISGSGSIDLLGVVAKSVSTETSGSGTTKIYATDHLNVNISGSGDVFYMGNPAVDTKISGSGHVSHL